MIDGPGKGKENESGEGTKMEKSEGDFWGNPGGKKKEGGEEDSDGHFPLLIESAKK